MYRPVRGVSIPINRDSETLCLHFITSHVKTRMNYRVFPICYKLTVNEF